MKAHAAKAKVIGWLLLLAIAFVGAGLAPAAAATGSYAPKFGPGGIVLARLPPRFAALQTPPWATRFSSGAPSYAALSPSGTSGRQEVAALTASNNDAASATNPGNASACTYVTYFGNSMALSEGLLFVGAPMYVIDPLTCDIGIGAVQIFQKVGGHWQLLQTLVPDDGTMGDYDEFGWGLAASGNTLLVGAPGGGGHQGAVYVFTQSNGTWSQTQKLMAADGVPADLFGGVISMEEGTAIISAPFATAGGIEYQGAAYIFTESNGVWSQTAKLFDTNAENGSWYTMTVALDGSTAMIGTEANGYSPESLRGAVEVFSESNGNWTLSQKLTPCGNANQYNGFGWAVALDGDTALVGSPVPWENDSPGAACLYTRSNGQWAYAQTLTAADGVGGDMFGAAVGLKGDTALVDAQWKVVEQGLSPGVIYAFRQTNGAWNLVDEIFRNAPGNLSSYPNSDWVGSNGFAFDGSAVLAGSPHTGTGNTVGVVNIFDYPAQPSSAPTALAFTLAANASGSGVLQLANNGIGAPLGFENVDGSELTQTSADTPVSWGATGCLRTPPAFDSWATLETHWFRRFYFNEHPQVGTVASVHSVAVGVSSAQAGSPFTINLYAIPHGVPMDTIDLSQLTAIGSADGAADGSFLTTLTIPVNGVVDDTVNKDLVVEFLIDQWDGSPLFVAGGNPAPQTHIALYYAPSCEMNPPYTPHVVGWDNVLMTVNLDAAASGIQCANPASTPWLGVSPAAGSVAAGATQDLTIDVDTTGLAPGTYSTQLCLTTSTPWPGLTQVPVNLTVTGGDVIFKDGFDGATR